MDRTRTIADRIAAILNHGIRLDDRTLHFMQSTFGLSEPEEIKKVLEEHENDEREILIPLIFSPDETRQIQLEPVLEAIGLGPSDVLEVHALVKSALETIRVAWPDHSRGFSIRVSGFSIEHFIAELHLERALDPSLLAVMDRFLPKVMSLAARVKLRNSRIDFSERNVIWLEAFFGAYELLEDTFDSLLALALPFLEDAPHGEDLYPVLMGLKKRCFSAVEKNAAFEASLRQFNMETLILQGKRASGMNTASAMDKMRRIDRICLALYGGTEHLESRVLHQDLGESPVEAILENITRMMGK